MFLSISDQSYKIFFNIVPNSPQNYALNIFLLLFCVQKKNTEIVVDLEEL